MASPQQKRVWGSGKGYQERPAVGPGWALSWLHPVGNGEPQKDFKSIEIGGILRKDSLVTQERINWRWVLGSGHWAEG